MVRRAVNLFIPYPPFEEVWLPLSRRLPPHPSIRAAHALLLHAHALCARTRSTCHFLHTHRRISFQFCALWYNIFVRFAQTWHKTGMAARARRRRFIARERFRARGARARGMVNGSACCAGAAGSGAGSPISGVAARGIPNSSLPCLFWRAENIIWAACWLADIIYLAHISFCAYLLLILLSHFGV